MATSLSHNGRGSQLVSGGVAFVVVVRGVQAWIHCTETGTNDQHGHVN